LGPSRTVARKSIPSALAKLENPQNNMAKASRTRRYFILIFLQIDE
jgi:hypothetical protein